MPILRQEPSLHPETLLDEAFDADRDRRWMVLYTKPGRKRH